MLSLRNLFFKETEIATIKSKIVDLYQSIELHQLEIKNKKKPEINFANTNLQLEIIKFDTKKNKFRFKITLLSENLSEKCKYFCEYHLLLFDFDIKYNQFN